MIQLKSLWGSCRNNTCLSAVAHCCSTASTHPSPAIVVPSYHTVFYERQKHRTPHPWFDEDVRRYHCSKDGEPAFCCIQYPPGLDTVRAHSAQFNI